MSDQSSESTLIQAANGSWWLETLQDGQRRASYLGHLSDQSVIQFASQHGINVLARGDSGWNHSPRVFARAGR